MKVSSRYRSVALLGAAALLASCTVSESKSGADSATTTTTSSTTVTTTTTPATKPATPASASAPTTTTTSSGAIGGALSAAALAGTWQMKAVPDSGTNTQPTEYTITAGQDTTGWKIAYRNGPTLPLRVTISGDSLITDTAPHRSVRGRSVMTTTHSVYRLDGNRLVGQTVAHYAVKTADSVLTLHVEGTKVP